MKDDISLSKVSTVKQDELQDDLLETSDERKEIVSLCWKIATLTSDLRDILGQLGAPILIRLDEIEAKTKRIIKISNSKEGE